MEQYLGRRKITKIGLGVIGIAGVLGLSGCGYESNPASRETNIKITVQVEQPAQSSSTNSYSVNNGRPWTEPTTVPPHPKGYDYRIGNNNIKQNSNHGYCPPKIQPKKCPPPPKCVRNRGYGRN